MPMREVVTWKIADPLNFGQNDFEYEANNAMN